jgi:hypothetical protein
MTERDDPEQKQAELLWRYVEELKQAENPEEVQFVAITRGECAEVVRLMEMAAEAYVLTRAESAPHCRREAIRQRLRACLIGGVTEERRADPAAVASRDNARLPAWLTAPLTFRSTGWVAAVAALSVLLWFVMPRSEKQAQVIPMGHASAVAAIPRFIRGELTAEASRAFLAHLIECKGCLRRYQEELKAVRAASRSLHQSRLPEETSGAGPRSRRRLQAPRGRPGGVDSLTLASAAGGR